MLLNTRCQFSPLAVFKLKKHYPSERTSANIWSSSGYACLIKKTGTKRVMYRNELKYTRWCVERRSTKDSSSWAHNTSLSVMTDNRQRTFEHELGWRFHAIWFYVDKVFHFTLYKFKRISRHPKPFLTAAWLAQVIESRTVVQMILGSSLRPDQHSGS